MHALFRLPLLATAALLSVTPSLGLAESPLPDPVAPAVVGRPLDQLIPAPAPRHKAAPVRKAANRRAAASRVATKPVEARQPATKLATAATAATAAPTTSRADKRASNERADPPSRPDEVSESAHLARKGPGEGAYFTDPYRIAARKYYEAHPVLRPAVNWKVGEPVPSGAVVALLPHGLLAVLPSAPAGHHYVELGGEVVLIASQTTRVVDGISRDRAETALLFR